MSTDSRISARALASRKNGAKSRGPKTREGKARSARNALKHGLRAAKHVVLLDEDAAEFAALEAALVAELAPAGTLQTVLARRIAVAAWRLARADRIEADLFKERHIPDGGPGIALIRDGNGTRSFETLLRYRGAAMAEFSRALRTLKALQAEQAKPVAHAPGAALAFAGRQASRATDSRQACASKRTQARRRAPDGIRPARTTDARPRSARARCAVAAERARAAQRVGAGARAPDQPGAAAADRDDPCGPRRCLSWTGR